MNKTTIQLYEEVVSLLKRLSAIPTAKLLWEKDIYTFKVDRYKICLQTRYAWISELWKLDIPSRDSLRVVVSWDSWKMEFWDYKKLDERLGWMKKTLKKILVRKNKREFIQTEDELIDFISENSF